MRVMMMIKGDREPGHLPSEEFLAQMGKYNFEAGGEPEAEGEMEIRRLFELEEFGEGPPVE